jgi:hypothetical protein
MHPPKRSLQAIAGLIGALFLAFLPGCASMMKKPPYDVSVDAISGPAGVGGTSYQLIARDAAAPRDPVLHAKAIACVVAALADKGMFEAPPRTQPDLYITMDYGLGNTIPTVSGPPSVEKFLLLSARRLPDDPRSGPKGEELWNVRTSISVPGLSIEAPLPLLSIVAMDYIGTDTISEKTVQIPRDAPSLTRIVNAANGVLLGKAPTAPTTAGAPTSTP